MATRALLARTPASTCKKALTSLASLLKTIWQMLANLASPVTAFWQIWQKF